MSDIHADRSGNPNGGRIATARYDRADGRNGSGKDDTDAPGAAVERAGVSTGVRVPVLPGRA